MCRYYYPALPAYKGSSLHIININTKWLACDPTHKCSYNEFSNSSVIIGWTI